MQLLDSNIIIYLSKERISIDEVFANDERYAVSVITYMEVLGYDFASHREEHFIKKLLNLFEIVYIDRAIASKVIELRKQYKIKLPDAIICATSMVHNGVLLSNDIRLKNIEKLNIKILDIVEN